MSNREQQLLQIGFKKNEHQQCFSLYKYDKTWIINFWDLENFTDEEWEDDIEYTKNVIKSVKRRYKKYLREHEAYYFAEKEFKKKLRDKYNALNSQYQEGMIPKLGRYKLTEEAIKLEGKVELLKELMNECR